jgi:hypothetical protein
MFILLVLYNVLVIGQSKDNSSTIIYSDSCRFVEIFIEDVYYDIDTMAGYYQDFSVTYCAPYSITDDNLYKWTSNNIQHAISNIRLNSPPEKPAPIYVWFMINFSERMNTILEIESCYITEMKLTLPE